MKLKRFRYLQGKGMSDFEMMEILKCKVIPKLNISFDKLVFRYGIKSVYAGELYHYSVWEVYLNIIIREYQVPLNTLEVMMKNAIRSQKAENRKMLKQIMEKYNKIIKSKDWSD